MHKSLFFLLLSLSVVARANEELMADKYFSQKDLNLTSQEKAAIAIGKKWQTGSATSKPVAGHDGSIRFVFGSGQTQILCAVLQVCDIALQVGEQVNNLDVGDPRFLVEPAITGSGDSQRLHLLIKSLDVGLDTSLVVTTDRRTYHFRLRSSRHEFMPYVSFTYPEDLEAKWRDKKYRLEKERYENTLPESGEYLKELHFNYSLSGSSRIKPCRVFNDGVKTIIEMPATMRQGEAPTLLLLQDAGFLKKPETVMVNYRVQGNRYIVDSVFDQAILMAGVGSTQERVLIKRKRS